MTVHVKCKWLSIIDGPAVGGRLQVPEGAKDGEEIVLHFMPMHLDVWEDDDGTEHYSIVGGGAVCDPVTNEPLGPMVYAKDGDNLVFLRNHHNPTTEAEDEPQESPYLENPAIVE